MDEQKTPCPDDPDDPDDPGAERVGCARCGRDAGGPAPLTWTCSMENGTRRYLCDDCARANLRAIEGRLHSSWW